MCFEMGFLSLPTVSVECFDSRAPVSYQNGIERALDRLGGLGKYVRPGQRVLLKPDLMYDYPGDCGQTTSAEFTAAVGRMVAELGAYCLVAMGEHAHDMIKGALDQGFPPERAWVARTHEEMARRVKEVMKKNDVVFLKGSRRTRLDKVADILSERKGL